MSWGDECRYCCHKGLGCTHRPFEIHSAEDELDLITVEYLVDNLNVYKAENARMMKRIDELINRIQDICK